MEEDRILKIYYNPKYVLDNIEHESFVTYICDNGIYLTYDDITEKILQKPTFKLNDSNIDSYVESRGFEKVLEFDKIEIKWYNGYEDSDKKMYLVQKIRSIKNSIKNKSFNKFILSRTLHIVYIRLNLLLEKLLKE